ncbi:hypothetical protein M405DRAFT_629507 [Rhizopogon salebrosus TDB-379]|nr:hypothetical protein M405DRAFT_629507 [Rhizopogon salebrosus TDB-379]
MRISHPTSLSHSKFHDTTLVPGLETSSFAMMWCFGGHGGYSTTTASSVESMCQDSTFVSRYTCPIPTPRTSSDQWSPISVRVVSRTFALRICYRIPTLCLEHISRRHLHISLYRSYCYKTCPAALSNGIFSFTRTQMCLVNPPTPSSALVASQLILMCAYTRSHSSSTSQHHPLVLRCTNAHVVLHSMTTLTSTLSLCPSDIPLACTEMPSLQE